MKLKYFGSATVLVEHSGVRVLCDPWFSQGAYYGSWFQYPEPTIPEELLNVDYVYLTHVHPDHTDPGFLKLLPKNTTILICEYEEKYLKRLVESLGFTRVIEIPNQTQMMLSDDFFFEMYAADDVNGDLFALAHRCSPLKDYRRTLQIDSIGVFSGGGRVVVNLNDVPAGLAQIPVQYIKRKYKQIDVALVSYAGAGPYPQAYDMSDDAKMETAIPTAAGYLTNTTLQLLRKLDPAVYIPFAGGYILGGRLWNLNQFKGVCELDELDQMLAPVVKNTGLKGEMLILEKGGTFDVSRGGITGIFKGTDFSARDRFTKSLSSKKFDFDDDIDPGPLEEKVKLAHQTLLRKQKVYDYFSPWSLYVDVKDELFRIPFNGDQASRVEKAEGINLYAKIDKKLFNRILDRKANWNNAEVGSHITLKSNAADASYEPMVHFLSAYFQCPRVNA